MKDFLLTLKKGFKKGFVCSYSVITGVNICAGLCGYTIRDIDREFSFWQCLFLLLCIMMLLTFLFLILFHFRKHRGYNTEVNGKSVSIRVGNIFDESGWKIIPCNERFDTQVDDIIIAHNSLHGKMIDDYIDDLDMLRNSILEAEHDHSPLKFRSENGTRIYPLGRIIAYKDFLMLAFSHFDCQNKAYINVGEYEQILIRMWKELRRVYAAKEISMPLLGTGITDIHGSKEKNYTSLLRCILCTLRNSNFQPNKGISIILTKESIKKINMNEIREEF